MFGLLVGWFRLGYRFGVSFACFIVVYVTALVLSLVFGVVCRGFAVSDGLLDSFVLY